jgi:hypothetical protein
MSNKSAHVVAVIRCQDRFEQLERHQFLLEPFFEIWESLHSNSKTQPYSFDDLVTLVDMYQCHNKEAISNLKTALNDLRDNL